MLYYLFLWFRGVWILGAEVSERSVCSIFIGRLNKKLTYEFGTERVFWNVGPQNSDARESH